MKIIINNLAHTIADADGSRQILVPARVSGAGKNLWSKVKMTIGGGASHMALSQKLLKTLDIEVIETDEGNPLDENGAIPKSLIVHLDISLRSTPGGQAITLRKIPAIVSEGNLVILDIAILNQAGIEPNAERQALVNAAFEREITSGKFHLYEVVSKKTE